MKLVAIADTHIKSGSAEETLQPELFKLIQKADTVIHAGDFVTKQIYDELSDICELEAVFGNMDEPGLKKILPERKVIKVEDLKIGIIHEAALSINDTDWAKYMAREMSVNVLIFGHIHKPVIYRRDVLLVCPGSPTAPRLSDPGVVELNIEDGDISGRIITLEGPSCGALESMREFY